jgi:hypothetical protein
MALILSVGVITGAFAPKKAYAEYLKKKQAEDAFWNQQ